MRAHRLFIATLMVLAASGCDDDSRTTPPPSSTPGRASIAFGDCGNLVDLSVVEMPPDRAERLTFECGTLDVPLDHDDAESERLDVQVVRIHDSAQIDRVGSLVMNPGGPGNSGLAFAAYWASWLSDAVLEHFDVVTFDPRGVGASGGFNCPPIPEDSYPDVFPDLLSAEGYAFAAHVARGQATSCLDELGADRAAHLGTRDAARDLDLLRDALGDEQLSYLGFSYGAKLGAEYARQFPDRVRALVLDGPSHPRDDPVAIVERQVAVFEEDFEAWAEGCAERPTCERLGEPHVFLDGLLDRAREMPIPSHRPQGDVAASDATIMNAVAALLYSEDAWPLLDDVLAEAALGDSGSVHETIDRWIGRVRDPEQPETTDANLVINCTDSRPGPRKHDILAAARRLESAYPVFGRFGSGWLVGCKYWAGEREVLPVPVVAGAAPILVVGTRHDPATPYAGAVAMARVIRSGHLLTWDGHTHTAYGQTDCITEAVDAYLLDLVVPDEGTVCPA